MEEDHFSKEFDDAPMPHSIFFTKIGMPSTVPDSVTGSAARPPWLRAAVARQCRDAVCAGSGARRAQHHGTLTGSSRVALARNPRPRDKYRGRAAPVLRRRRSNTTSNTTTPAIRRDHAQAGVAPQARADDGYIYPSDGSSSDARYPPRAPL